MLHLKIKWKLSTKKTTGKIISIVTVFFLSSLKHHVTVISDLLQGKHTKKLSHLVVS
jgi:hypothetical protein